MSTTIGFVLDAVNTFYKLEVYVGTGGVGLLMHAPGGEPPSSKLWLDRDGINKLMRLLREAMYEAPREHR